jgi:serine/threonine protein phosphatase PrpC
MPLSEIDPKIRIIVPPPRATKVEHEVASATSAGGTGERNDDAVGIFTLGVPSEDWNGVVLAVADGKGWSGRGDVASAVAVEALEDGLTGWAEHLEFSSHAWQEPVAQALASAFDQANAKVRGLADGTEPGSGVALTAAAVLGNWLCVAHAGDSRVYRFSKNELEQMTADHGRLRLGRSRTADRSRTPAPGVLDDRPVRALGLAAHVTPAIRFFRLRPGDVVLVCSNGLCRHLDGEDLAQLLGARRQVAEIAKSLVAAATERGSDDDMSACLARVGRLPSKPLPDPVGRVTVEQVSEAESLPRYRTRASASGGAGRFVAFLGAIMVLGGAVGGFWYWLNTREPAHVAVADTVRLQQSGSEAPVALPLPLDTVPADTAAVVDSAPPPPVSLPVRDSAVQPRAGEIVPGDSLEIIQRQINDLRERRRKDSLAAVQKERDEQRRRDSVLAVEASEAAEQRVRDSLTLVARRETEARQRREAAARAEQQERERRAAEARSEQEATERAEREREARLTAGRAAVTNWMNSLVSNVNAGNVGAPVLRAGPPDFASFVDKRDPWLSDALLSSVNVSEQSAEATAEWTAKWRTEFGASRTRRMKATATLVPEGDAWRLRSWRIIEGAP